MNTRFGAKLAIGLMAAVGSNAINLSIDLKHLKMDEEAGLCECLDSNGQEITLSLLGYDFFTAEINGTEYALLADYGTLECAAHG